MELMVPLNRMRGRLRPAFLIAALMAGVAVPALGAGSFFGPQPPARDDGRILVAQNNQAAELLVRIQDLEQSVRDLTGRVEGLEFQLRQLLKVNEDYEYRLQQLEGTAPVGKPQAAVPTDGVTPPDALPQEQNPVVSADTPVDQLQSTPDRLPADLADAPELSAEDVPMDGIGESADPLLRGGIDQLGTLNESDDFANVPLDLNLPQTALSSGDAKAQFEAGRDAMNRGDYAFASEQLSQFLEYYRDDPLAPDAVNYLGEALIQQSDFQQASQVLAQGYIDYSKSNRAPDIMLRLGVALSGLGQGELACENFAKLRERYPNVAPRFKQRLEEEAQKAQCPAG